MKEKVELFYDLFDEAAVLHYQYLGLRYLEALFKIADGVLNGNIDSRFPEDAIQKLETIYTDFEDSVFYNEEVRLALELLIVKAFKDKNLSLDLMTPDTINYLFSKIIATLFPKREITILDTALGTGNMLFAIHNNLPSASTLIGIEKDETLARLAEMSANLQGTELLIYCQDALQDLYEEADIIVGDLDAYFLEEDLKLGTPYLEGIRYFPYLVILKRLVNLKPNGYFIFLVNNDFFSQPKSDIFKAYLEKEAMLSGLIVLPKTIFQENHPGRSIIIGKKYTGNVRDISILEIPSFEKESLKRSFEKLEIMIENIAEEKKC